MKLLTMDDIYDSAELEGCFTSAELESMLTNARSCYLHHINCDCPRNWKSETKIREAVSRFITDIEHAIVKVKRYEDNETKGH
jgi:hypothetical protein